MRVFLTIVILVSLCLSAEAINVQSLLHKHRSLKQNKDKDAQASVKAPASPSPEKQPQFKEQTKTATQTQAAAKTTQAAAKATDKKADSKTIEHITKEPPPPGMVRPVLVPPPDALPNTFKFKPIVEGQNMPARALHGNVFRPEFTEKGKGEAHDAQQDSGWWHHHSHSNGPTVVEATEGKPGYIDTDSANWPPKFPPCSGCEEQEPEPPQCCMVMAMPPFSRGYWHAHGHMHIHHVHTPDESPEQMESEDAAAAQEEEEEEGDDQEGEEEESPEGAEETPEDAAAAAAAESIDASTGGAAPAQPNEQEQLSSTAVEASTPSEGTAGEDPVATVSVVLRLVNEAVLKSHDAIVTDMTAKLDEHKTSADKQLLDVQTHLESEIKGIGDMLAKLIEKWGNPETAPGGPKIVINNVHHHHHHHDDDDDDDDDDDSDDVDAEATKFTSTAGSTIDLLKSMEAETESLTQKMDQADTLQSAADTSADDDADDDDEDS